MYFIIFTSLTWTRIKFFIKLLLIFKQKITGDFIYSTTFYYNLLIPKTKFPTALNFYDIFLVDYIL